MTVLKIVVVRCDGPLSEDEGCDIEPGGVSDMDSPSTVAGARADARDQGWSRTRDGRDLCPACREAR